MEIDINEFEELKENVRIKIETDTEFRNLMSSIKQNGLIVPLTYMEQNGVKIIVTGHRRLLALKKLGWKKLEIGKHIIQDEENLNLIQVISKNVAENLHRVGNSPVELVRIIRLLKETGLNNSEIAINLTMSKAQISTLERLGNKTPREILAGLKQINTSKDKSKLSVSIANAISNLRIKDEDVRRLYATAKEEEFTLGDIKIIGLLLKDGMSFDKALSKRKEYSYKSIDLTVKTDKLEALQRLHGSFQKTIIKILKKELPLSVMEGLFE